MVVVWSWALTTMEMAFVPTVMGMGAEVAPLANAVPFTVMVEVGSAKVGFTETGAGLAAKFVVSVYAVVEEVKAGTTSPLPPEMEREAMEAFALRGAGLGGVELWFEEQPDVSNINAAGAPATERKI